MADPSPRPSPRRSSSSTGGTDKACAAPAPCSLPAMLLPHAGRDSLLEMKEVPGGSKPLRSWERWYWGVGVAGISAVLYWNLKKPDKTPEEIEVQALRRMTTCWQRTVRAALEQRAKTAAVARPAAAAAAVQCAAAAASCAADASHCCCCPPLPVAAAAPQAAKQRAAELEVKRKEHLRAVLMGQNFLEGV